MLCKETLSEPSGGLKSMSTVGSASELWAFALAKAFEEEADG